MSNKDSSGKNEGPGYYAIIPATVRYSKSLSPNAKLLYGEITALCNQEGYCWASNSYFAKLYDVQRSSVSNWIKSLSDAGFISIELVYAKGKPNIEERKIYITDMSFKNDSERPSEVNAENGGGGQKNDQGGQLADQGVVKFLDGGGQKTRKRILQANNTKEAAADQRQSEIEKPPEKAAAEPFQGKNGEHGKPDETSKQDIENLKAHLKFLNPDLLFLDEDFYPQILAFLAKHELDLDYVSWFYRVCLRKNPKRLCDYFFKVFPHSRYVGMYHEEKKPPPAAEIFLTICPACSIQHDAAASCCPQCELRKADRKNPNEVFIKKRLYEMPPENKAHYLAGMDFIVGNREWGFEEKIRRIADLNREYGMIQTGIANA